MVTRARTRADGSALARRALVALFATVLAAPALAVDGDVVDEAGKPIGGVRVCYFVDNVELLCSETDAQGRFGLPDSGVDTIRAQAEGYDATIFSAATLDGPVTLKLAAALVVRLADRATGERIEKGEVVVVYPTGKEKGPFPANAAGVHIRRGLPRGEIRVIGKAEGFLDSPPRELKLEAGKKIEVVLELDPVPTDDGTD